MCTKSVSTSHTILHTLVHVLNVYYDCINSVLTKFDALIFSVFPSRFAQFASSGRQTSHAAPPDAPFPPCTLPFSLPHHHTSHSPYGKPPVRAAPHSERLWLLLLLPRTLLIRVLWAAASAAPSSASAVSLLLVSPLWGPCCLRRLKICDESTVLYRVRQRAEGLDTCCNDVRTTY